MEKAKTEIRTASRIRDALACLKRQKYFETYAQLNQYNDKLKEITKESNLVGKALSKHWFASIEICTNRIDRLLADVTYSIQRIKQFTANKSIKVPTFRELFEELNQLQDEFAKIEFSSDEDTISVITEPIELESVYLGPFEIKLHIDKLSELYKDLPYYCIALDPNPAATSEDVTHPHVSNEKLCEGDGHTAIRAALGQGRLTDFFSMVKSILNTYNPDSPYVSIYEWEGTACYSCGYVVSGEDCYYCCRCERDFCSECSTYCQNCDETICLGCAGKCEICDEPICSSCIQECAECGRYICQRCICQEDLCPDCEQLIKDNENEEQDKEDNQKSGETGNSNRTGVPAGSQIQPNSVGEAAVLQGQNR
jgi:hypothetical protein